jgi:phosphohistidine phosphatase
MKLYLMRHGDYSTEDIRHQNPLSKKGQDDISRLASFLKLVNIHVTYLFHSEKLRTKQTAAILASSLHCKEAPKEYRGLNPLDDVTTFMDTLTDEKGDVFIVGHLPFLARLLGLLVVRDENQDVVAFQQGTLVCLEKIETARWIINWVINPELFPIKRE